MATVRAGSAGAAPAPSLGLSQRREVIQQDGAEYEILLDQLKSRIEVQARGLRSTKPAELVVRLKRQNHDVDLVHVRLVEDRGDRLRYVGDLSPLKEESAALMKFEVEFGKTKKAAERPAEKAPENQP